MKLGNDPPSALVLTGLERAVLAALAGRLGADGVSLAAQGERLRVVHRSHSGVGFVTRLEVPPDLAPLSPAAAARLRPVRLTHPALREPAEVVVQLKDGRLAAIEAFCFEGLWPADEAAFSITPAAG